jgi:hypothetical protein
MPVEADELKRKLEEMLASSDTEWANSVTVTLNAMYRQFDLERRSEKITVLSPSSGTAKPQKKIGLLYRELSQDRIRMQHRSTEIPSLYFLILFP